MKKIVLILIFCPLTLVAQTTLLKNVNIVDVVNETILENKNIEVKDGLIIGIHDSSFEVQSDAITIDLNGKYVIPGLIDSHTHIEHSAYWSKSSKYNPPRENLIELLNHALLGGITTIREMACDVRVVGELSRLADLNRIAAPDIYYPSVFAGPRFFKDPRAAAGALGETPGNVSWFRAVSDDTDLSNVIAQAKGNGSHALKLYALLKPEQIKAIAAEAKKQDLKIWAHAYTQFAKPSDIIKSGVNDVSHAPLLLFELSDKPKYESYPEDDSALQELFSDMIANNVSLDPTIFVFDNAEGYATRSSIAKQITTKAMQAGVRIIAGTDSISAYKDENLPFIHKEIASYVNECKFSTMQAIQSATINPAITLGIETEVGSIEKGKKANLVILEGNPIEDISNTQSIHMVMKEGLTYYPN